MIKVLPAQERHIPQMLEVWKEFMDFHGQHHPYYARAPDGHDRFADWVRELVKNEDSLVLVALDGDRVVGHLVARVEQRPAVFLHGRYGFVCDTAVASSHQRRGVGSRMDQAVALWFAERGVDHVELLAATGNEHAQGFWRKRGYVPMATVMCRDT
jgi:ribosomal protein S18 acetylase RimI-like enzyme